MLGSNLFLLDDVYDADEHLKEVEAYLLQEAGASTSLSTKSRGLFLTDQNIKEANHAMQAAKINENLPFNITPAYDVNGKPNYLDEHGEIICGIYSDLENEVYHSLPAISSSQIKKYAKSPAHYKRTYIDQVNRKRQLAKSTEKTFDTGTYSHELILEGEGFYDRYFRLLNAAEHENSLHTIAELKEKCKELSLAVSGTKTALIERIVKRDPTVKIFDAEQQKHIQDNVGEKAYLKALEVMSETSERLSLIDALKHKDVKPLLLKTPIDAVIWDDAHRAERTVRSHEWANEILQDGFAELSVFARCPVTGRMLKVRFDWLSRRGIPADLKTTRSANPLQAAYQFADLGYDLQSWYYTHVGRLAGIPCEDKVFPIIAVEFLEADICQVFELSDEDWVIAERNCKRHIVNLHESLLNDDWPGYTRRNGSTLLRLPKRGRE